MKRFQNITLLLFLFCTSTFYSQVVLPKNDLDDKYTPNSSSMFNNLVKKTYDENSYIEIEFKNNVKYNLTSLARQKIFFTYERQIYKSLVVTGGLGKAFGKDFIQNSFFTAGLSRFDDIALLSPQDALSNCTYLSSRPFFQLGGKVYFSGTAFDEAFFEFNYRRERMDYLLSPSISGNRIDGENDLIFKMNAFSFGFGFTSVSGDKNNIIHEFYLTFGLKTFKYTQFDFMSIQNPVNLKSELVYRKGSDFVSTRILPTLNIGYSFGFGW